MPGPESVSRPLSSSPIPLPTPPSTPPLPMNDNAVLTSGCAHHTPPPPVPPHLDAPPPPTPAAQSAAVGPFIIGVTGASASGKTTVCDKIINGLGDQRCVVLSLDWFYHGLPNGVNPGDYNFDHPDAFDFSALRDTLLLMKGRRPVKVPRYDFARHCRDLEKCEELDVADVVIVEGILSFYDKEIRDMMHMKIFVDEDADICLSRRITRDVKARGRSVESILEQYAKYVKPSFEEYIQPTKRHSDIVVPRGGENLVAIDLIIKHIALKIRQQDLRKVYSNLVVMADSYQTRGLHTIFRQREATREDFVFYSDRLMRLLIEEGLGLLPFERKTVVTPTGGTFYGVAFVQGLIGLSVMPGGDTMEGSLRAVCNTIRIGKIMIGEKGEVLYQYLPKEIDEKYILILEPVMNSGNRAEGVIRRLKELGCREDHIMVLSLIVSPQAVVRICGNFGGVQVVVSAVDRGLDEDGKVYPGVGDFAERYYGSEVTRTGGGEWEKEAIDEGKAKRVSKGKKGGLSEHKTSGLDIIGNKVATNGDVAVISH